MSILSRVWRVFHHDISPKKNWTLRTSLRQPKGKIVCSTRKRFESRCFVTQLPTIIFFGLTFSRPTLSQRSQWFISEFEIKKGPTDPVVTQTNGFIARRIISFRTTTFDEGWQGRFDFMNNSRTTHKTRSIDESFFSPISLSLKVRHQWKENQQIQSFDIGQLCLIFLMKLNSFLSIRRKTSRWNSL